MFYVNLKVFQQPRILFKSLLESQFEYCKFELETKMAQSLHHQNIRTWKYKCLKFTLDFQMSLFWICFIIIMKITFTVFDLNPIQHDFARYFRRVICNNIPIETRSVKILTHLIQK